MKTHHQLLFTTLLLALVSAASANDSTPTGIGSWKVRQALLQQEMLTTKMPDYSGQTADDQKVSRILKYHIGPIAARIMLGSPEEQKQAFKNLTHLMKISRNTQFAPWTFTHALQSLLPVWDKTPEQTKATLKQMLQNWNYPSSAGTINMRFYLYTAGYLGTETFPDFTDSATPPNPAYAASYRNKNVGKIKSHTAAELQAYCRERILDTLDFFVKRNGIEHSKVYFMSDLESVLMLARYAKDAQMRTRATLAADYFLLNLATDWNFGEAIEPTFREKGFPLAGTGMNNTETTGWMYFGGSTKILSPGILPPIFLTPGYELPPVIEAIAQDRSGIRIKREISTQEHEHIYDDEDADEKNATPAAEDAAVPASVHPVNFKTYFHAPGYSLASGFNDYSGEQGIKVSTFKEQRMTDLRWSSDHLGNGFFVFQENICQPYFNKTAPNKFGIGENPFSQRMQYQQTVIGIYNVPTDYPYYKQATVYTRDGAIIERLSRNGWEFCDAGTVLFGFYSFAPTIWNNQKKKICNYTGTMDVRWCDSRKNAWILETGDPAEYSATNHQNRLSLFADAVLGTGKVDTSHMNQSIPAFSYASPYGYSLSITFKPLTAKLTDQHLVNGKPIEYRSWKMLDSPWAEQDRNSSKLSVHYAGVSLEYDFNSWTVSGNRVSPIAPQVSEKK